MLESYLRELEGNDRSAMTLDIELEDHGYRVVNEDLDTAVRETLEIVKRERLAKSGCGAE